MLVFWKAIHMPPWIKNDAIKKFYQNTVHHIAVPDAILLGPDSHFFTLWLFKFWGPFDQYGLAGIRACIINYIHNSIWDIITHQSSNF